MACQKILQVYQSNVHVESRKFQSFKKVASEMGCEYAGLEMASFMSASKGYTGEYVYSTLLNTNFAISPSHIFNVIPSTRQCDEIGQKLIQIVRLMLLIETFIK